MAKILNLRSSESTLLQVYSEAVEAKEVKHMAEMYLVLEGIGRKQDIMEIDKAKRFISKNLTLEGLGSVPETEGKAKKFKEAKRSNSGSLRNVSGSHGNLEITFLDIKFRKELGTCDPGREIRNGEEQISVWVGGGVETNKIYAGPPGSIRFRDHVERS